MITHDDDTRTILLADVTIIACIITLGIYASQLNTFVQTRACKYARWLICGFMTVSYIHNMSHTSAPCFVRVRRTSQSTQYSHVLHNVVIQLLGTCTRMCSAGMHIYRIVLSLQLRHTRYHACVLHINASGVITCDVRGHMCCKHWYNS